MLEIKIKQMTDGWLLEVRKGQDKAAKMVTIKSSSVVRLGVPIKMFVNYITKTLENFDEYLLEEQTVEQRAEEKVC